jgi:hypothetical protein
MIKHPGSRQDPDGLDGGVNLPNDGKGTNIKRRKRL